MMDCSTQCASVHVGKLDEIIIFHLLHVIKHKITSSNVRRFKFTWVRATQVQVLRRTRRPRRALFLTMQ